MNKFLLPSLLLVCLNVSLSLAENVIFRIRTGNLGRTERTVEIQKELPHGVRPQHILDSAGLDVRYDSLADRYYLYKEMNLAPTQVVDLAIVLDDVWHIPADFVEQSRDHLEFLENALDGHSVSNRISELWESMRGHLERLSALQATSSIARVGMDAHFAAYESAVDLVTVIRRGFVELEDAAMALGKDPGVLMGEISFSAVRPIPEAGDSHSLVYRIRVKNPSPNAPRVLDLKEELPEEIRAQDVLERGELRLVVTDKGRCRMELDGVEIPPLGQMEYRVVVRDRWNIHGPALRQLGEEIRALRSGLAAVKKTFPSVLAALDKVQADVEMLQKGKGPGDLDDRYVAFYREQGRRLAALEACAERIRRAPLPHAAPSAFGVWPIIVFLIVSLVVMSLAVLFRAQRKDR